MSIIEFVDNGLPDLSAAKGCKPREVKQAQRSDRKKPAKAVWVKCGSKADVPVDEKVEKVVVPPEGTPV